MSLFGSYVGDFEDDPFFGAHLRQMHHMNHMVNSMFANGPFGMMGGMGGMGGMPSLMGDMGPRALTAPHHMGTQDLMPFGFPNMNMNMNSLFHGMGDMAHNPECHSYSSSTMLTMSSGPDGRPLVYQESSSTRTAPGGVKEVKKSSSDSRSGVKKIAIGHHIGDRAHVLEREQNVISGDQEERQEFINLEEEEAGDFNNEFERKIRHTQQGAINYRQGRRHRSPQLALPSTHASSSRPRLRGTSARKNSQAAIASPSSSPTESPVKPSQERTRKRDHEPEPEAEHELRHKTLKPSDSEETIQILDLDESIQILD